MIRTLFFALALATSFALALSRTLLSQAYTKPNDVENLQISPTGLEDRARGAIIGAYVADAASMGLHWIYDPNTIRQHIRQAGRNQGVAEFFDPPASPFYHYKSGSSSPYGDEVLPLLQSLAEERDFVPRSFVRTQVQFMAGYHGYVSHAIKAFLHHEAHGRHFPGSAVDDDQAHSLLKVPALVARYAGEAILTRKVEEAVSVHQSSAVAKEMAVAFALVLERVVLTGEPAQESVKWAARGGNGMVSAQAVEALSEVFNNHRSLEEAAGMLGRSCHLPGAFQVAMYAVANMGEDSGSTGVDYESVLRANIVAAGDQCSRAMVIGALLGAEMGGDHAIPQSWLERMDPERLTLVRTLADQIVASRERLQRFRYDDIRPRGRMSS